jgi:hypothetical protein
MKEAHTKTDGVEARARWGSFVVDEKAYQEWRSSWWWTTVISFFLSFRSD